MSNHTPGPWTVEVRNDWVNSYDQLPLVCEVDDLVIVAKDGMIGSNGGDAHIIAAAPDMLEALKEAVSDLEAYVDAAYPEGIALPRRRKLELDCIQKYKAIIAKAEGGDHAA